MISLAEVVEGPVVLHVRDAVHSLGVGAHARRREHSLAEAEQENYIKLGLPHRKTSSADNDDDIFLQYTRRKLTFLLLFTNKPAKSNVVVLRK